MRDVDEIIQRIQQLYPTVGVGQLQVSHLGDDDGIWYFDQPGSEYQVQIESSRGMCPFLVETDENETRITANSVDETVQTVAKLLHLLHG